MADVLLPRVVVYTNLYCVTNWCIMAVLKLWTAVTRSEFNPCGSNFCGLSYKVWSTFITKFGIIESFILILGVSAIYTGRLVAMLWQHQRLVHNTYKLYQLRRSVRLLEYLLLHLFYNTAWAISHNRFISGSIKGAEEAQTDLSGFC